MNDIASNRDTLVLCPGQGAQHVGMGAKWHEHHLLVRRIFATANEQLGFDLAALCVAGPEEKLNRTDVAQLAIFTTSIAAHAALQDAGELSDHAMTAGLSLGEFTALHLAGAFSFEQGLKLVQIRGQAMQQAAEASDSGMVALIGADEPEAQQLCDDAKADDVLVPANFNCPGQIVISGSRAACDRSLGVAEKMGIRATRLKVAGAFHSPLMQPAADRLAQALEAVDWQIPAVPVLSNVTGQLHEQNDIASIKRRLVEQLTQPVRWAQNMAWAAAHFKGRFVELPPGKVLSGLMRRIDRKTKVENLAEPVTANKS